jgi:hypothetical protein
MALGPEGAALCRSFLRGSSSGLEPDGIVVHHRVWNPAASSPVVTAVYPPNVLGCTISFRAIITVAIDQASACFHVLSRLIKLLPI